MAERSALPSTHRPPASLDSISISHSGTQRGIRVLKQIRAGILWLNTYHPTYNEAPWGGYKQSGFGRELGSYGLEQYLETKQINLNLSEAPIGWY